MQVFVSYSWNDVPLRRALVAELRSRPGIKVLIDSGEIRASDPLHPTISDLIDKADLIVAILTSSSLASKEVLDELVRAHDRKKRILSFVEQATPLESLPHFLRDLLRIEFTSNGFDNAVETFVGAVAKLMESSSPHQGEPAGKLKSHLIPTTVREFTNPELDWLQRSNLGRELLEQVIAMCAIHPFTWNDGKDQVTPIFVSPNTFIPDGWTRTLINGLLKVEGIREAQTVVEIGVGTGIVPIVLGRAGFTFAKFYGFDIDTLAIRVGNLNAKFHGINHRTAFKGGTSLFEPERSFELGEEYADLVVANIPQVPSLTTGPIRDLFDYYHMPIGVSSKKKDWAMRGLWLVSEILEQARSRLKRDGKIVLNVGGRPGDKHILQMFLDCGYQAKIVHSEIIAQDAETDISALVHFERTNHVNYEFYSHMDCMAPISAMAAYELIAEGQKAYHYLYVIEAVRIK